MEIFLRVRDYDLSATLDSGQAFRWQPDNGSWTGVIGRRQVRSGNSWMHNLPILAKGPYRCTALVHPSDAERLGLQHAELVIRATGVKSLTIDITPMVEPLFQTFADMDARRRGRSLPSTRRPGKSSQTWSRP